MSLKSWAPIHWVIVGAIAVALFMAGWATHLVADNINQARINHNIHIQRCQIDGTDSLGFGPEDCSDVRR